MANPIIRFEGQESNFINEKQLNLTVRLSPQSWVSSSYLDVLNILEEEGLKAEDILGLYKVSASDSNYSLFLSNEDALNFLKEKKVIGNSRLKFNVVGLTEQVVSLRIHWLPLFYDNRLLKAIFCDYGEVIDVRLCKSSHAKLCALNGMREVLLKTDEILKQKIPHMVNFGSGQSILVTMSGRPPLCLKCREVGHVRRDCGSNRSFANVTRQRTSEESVVGRPAAPATSESPVGTSSGTSDPVDVPLPAESGTDGSEAGEVGSEDQQRNGEEVMDAEAARSKRGRDQVDDDFITPNNPVRRKSPTQVSVPLKNGFSPIMHVGDIMSDSET